MVDKERIGLVTTISNWELYEKTNRFFPKGIKIYGIDGTKGFFGLNSLLFSLDKLRNKDLDWLIMADEDVIFLQPNKVFDLIQYMEENNFTACGLRDGGMLNWRNKNPYVINHFFAILNLKTIFAEYNKEEIRKNQFLHEDEFPDDLSQLPYSYDITSFNEPYYCFYLWLRRKKRKILFLNGSVAIPGDFATTLVQDHEGDSLLYHTWFARFYGKDSFHTERIDKVLKLTTANSTELLSPKPILLKYNSSQGKFFIYRIWRKILRLKNSKIGAK